MYHLLRPFLFMLAAETAHRLVLGVLAALCHVPGALWLLRRLYRHTDPRLRVRAMGLEFQNPVGLAAGLDKDAQAFDAFGALGFGLVEVGTLTGAAQPGNQRPRLFRLPRDHALINRMGFNNSGAEQAARRMTRRRELGVRLGANIGRTKLVPNDAAIADYVKSTHALAAHVDYLVINVSSPNTPGLRDLQDEASLTPLLAAVRDALEAAVPNRRIPLLVKIAPDLEDAEIDAIADAALALGLDGIIATNTTTSRAGLSSPASLIETCGPGGLSGAPLAERSLHVLKRLRARVGSRITLVSSGGIQSGDDAFARIRAGATLVQVYTALIYEGPALPGKIASRLAECLREAGYATVSEAIGSDVPARE